MRRLLSFLLAGILSGFVFANAQASHKLLVISVDGLDWRYLRDRNQLGLLVPTVRRLLKGGRYADGVVGVWPTITWPSHTSLITGVRPDQHGIRSNRRPPSEGGDYPWSADLLNAQTLWQVAKLHGLTTASVTWPVTVDAPETFNLPEYFKRRNGGSMDLDSVESKSTSGLVDDISKGFPSFRQQWIDDRTRTLAVLYLLKNKQPDLLLVHLVDLDSEEHDCGPFEQHSRAIMERTDELIGEMLSALPRNYDLSLVSDHGFERVDRTANLKVLLSQHGIKGDVRPMGGIVTTTDAAVAEYLRSAQKDPANGIGREIPHDELLQYAPELKDVLAAFEPEDHVMFGASTKEPYFSPPYEKGNHGFWPMRHDYRSVFVLYGPGIKAGHEPEMQMLSIAGRLAAVLGIDVPGTGAK